MKLQISPACTCILPNEYAISEHWNWIGMSKNKNLAYVIYWDKFCVYGPYYSLGMYRTIELTQ